MLLGPTPLTSALVGHAALCEAGWELQDCATRAYQLAFGGAKGKALNPTPLLVIFLLHHVTGLGMVVPMNLLYRDNALYHELVFMLQFAAFVAMGSQQFGFTLDVATASGLRSMKIAVGVSWIGIAWSRVVRFAWVGWSLFWTLHGDGRLPMVVLGGVALAGMGTVNLLFFSDACCKLSKYLRMRHHDAKRAGSVVPLVTEAAATATGPGLPIDDITDADEDRAGAVTLKETVHQWTKATEVRTEIKRKGAKAVASGVLSLKALPISTPSGLRRRSPSTPRRASLTAASA